MTIYWLVIYWLFIYLLTIYLLVIWGLIVFAVLAIGLNQSVLISVSIKLIWSDFCFDPFSFKWIRTVEGQRSHADFNVLPFSVCSLFSEVLSLLFLIFLQDTVSTGHCLFRTFSLLQSLLTLTFWTPSPSYTVSTGLFKRLCLQDTVFSGHCLYRTMSR